MKNGERTRLLHDHAIIGEGVPMMSKSQKPLLLHDVVYSGEAGVSGYDDDRHVGMEIITWRVIQVNYQDRYVRIRNMDGCEQTVSFSEGCARLKLHHNFNDLRSDLLMQLQKAHELTKKKISERERLLLTLEGEAKKVEKMKAPEAPVKVKTSEGFEEQLKAARKWHMEAGT